MSDINSDVQKAKSMKTHSIVGIVLFFTIIGAIASCILGIVDSVTILSRNWSDKQVNDDKLLWGLLSLLLLANIGTLIFAKKVIESSKNPIATI